MTRPRLTRRTLIHRGAAGGALAGAASLPLVLPHANSEAHQTNDQATPTGTGSAEDHAIAVEGHDGHSLSMTVGDVDLDRVGMDPSEFVTTFDYGEVTTMADGTTVREWEIVATSRVRFLEEPGEVRLDGEAGVTGCE